MSDNIFGNTPQQTTVDNNNTAQQATNVQNADSNQFNDLLNQIKNERGEPKYRDTKTALEALRASQDYIPQLKTENETLKAQLESMSKRLEELSAVKDSLDKLSFTQQQQPQATGVVDESKVAELVNSALTQQRQKEMQTQNITSVVEAAKRAFGDKADELFYAKAEEAGLSKEQINALAASSPKAVLKLLGIQEGNASQNQFNVTPPVSTQNSSVYQGQPQSFVGKNQESVLIGSTHNDLMSEHERSKKLVEEIHQQGKTVYDLTDPKVYFKLFN